MSPAIRAVSFKLEPELVAYLDRLAVRLSHPGVSLGRADALRYVITTAKAADPDDVGEDASAPKPAKAARTRRAK